MNAKFRQSLSHAKTMNLNIHNFGQRIWRFQKLFTITKDVQIVLVFTRCRQTHQHPKPKKTAKLV
jgi:hypothetical protein